MKEQIFQPIVFNLITIVAMMFTLFQGMVAVSQNTATPEVIELIEGLGEKGDIDATMGPRLEAERQQRLRLANYIMISMMIAILANVFANYFGRGRQFENTARIRELEAEIRVLRDG